MLSQPQIKRFQEIWGKHFGREISAEEADREGSRLVRIVRLICKTTTAGGDQDAGHTGSFPVKTEKTTKNP